MQWVWERFDFRCRSFRLAHFEALATGVQGQNQGKVLELVEDSVIVGLDRCEAELGACLWHDTNLALLRYLERHLGEGYEGVRVLELGAGAGAIGIALALDGAAAVVTDLPALVPLMEVNLRGNGLLESATVVGSNASGSSRPAPRRKRKGRGKQRAGDAEDSDDEPQLREGPEGASAGAVEELPRRISAKERRAQRAAKKETVAAAAAADVGDASDGEGCREDKEEAPCRARGSCVARAADWAEEAREGRLAANAFDLVAVCDCLYENRESWGHLEVLLRRCPAANGEVVLAAATLRRPFLEDFLQILIASGHFELSTKEVQEVATIAVLRRLAESCDEAG